MSLPRACHYTASRPGHVVKLRHDHGMSKTVSADQGMSYNCVPTRAMQKLRGVSENCKVLTSERSLQSDDSINANRLIKYAIRVTALGHAHKMPITPSFMQAGRSAYTKRMEEEKARKDKDMQQNTKTA